MNLTEAIKDLQTGTKHYKLIVANQDSIDCINECKSLIFDDMVKLNISEKLAGEILLDKTKEEKEFESWDLIKDYLRTFNSRLFILYDVEYMFSPDLGNLDVINNFKYYSRNGHIIVLFIKGKLIDNHLIYSEEGKPDYRDMDVSEVVVMGW